MKHLVPARTLLLRSMREFRADNSMQTAAAISYYVLFSLFPLLIFAVGVAGLFLQSSSVQQDIVDEVLKDVPLNEGEGRNAVTDAVHAVSGPGGGAVGFLGLIGMAWAGSSMFGAVRKALNTAFDDEEAKRPFVQQRLIDLGLVLALAAFFLASIALMAFLRIVRHHTSDIPGPGDIAETLGLLWDAGSYLLPLVFSFAAFLVLYTVVPGRMRPPRDVWPGALVAAVLFEAAKAGFSFYLENFSNYDLVFGSLGAVAAFLFWLYLSANIMLFGAEVASEYPIVRAGEYEQPALEGMKLLLRERAWHTVRRLFLREEAPARDVGRDLEVTARRPRGPRVRS